MRAMFLEGDAGHKRRERVYIRMTENNKERYSRPLGNPSNNKAFNLTFMPYRLCIPQIESLRKSSIQLGISRRVINRRQCRPRIARKLRVSGMFVTKCIQSQQKRSLKKSRTGAKLTLMAVATVATSDLSLSRRNLPVPSPPLGFCSGIRKRTPSSNRPQVYS